ncbi:MAG TPA: aminotransferase class I/II-fold pyridoxal phosphate-dependent enzyme, partial [Myxococcota bacterium]|nr:aminotransferase class I/II-fold pyridoxal phosphate-dependent enzyme [Myxococcota bacterium]
HLAALPALIDERDAILMDQQVHSSVQLACQYVATTGAKVELLPHNDLARLERRIKLLAERHHRIWYMADGVYSMFGDRAPMREIRDLLERYESLRLYVDDAHGMSWCGPRGSGTVLDTIEMHPHMVLVTSLAKGFGTGGGVIVLPDEEQRRRVQQCGPTLIFAGPIQPPILGAIVESAKIHLSDEIHTLQAEVRERMALCHGLLAERGSVPVVSSPETPVGFIGTGPVGACQSLVERLMGEGFFTNPAQFPAAPLRRSGLRFLLTRHHEAGDIERLVDAIDRHWPEAVREGGATPEAVFKAFGLEPPVATSRPVRVERAGLHLDVASSIDKLDAAEWDGMMSDKGCLGSSAMRVFERVFGPEAEPENRWDFRYYVVRDADGRPVLATCFTRALWKADMLAPSTVSATVEQRRTEDPHFLTQQVFAMGCLLSEGDHLWLRDPAEAETSREAMAMLLDAVRADAQALGCEVRVFRDIPAEEREVCGILEQSGMMPMPAPDSLVLDGVPADDEALI